MRAGLEAAAVAAPKVPVVAAGVRYAFAASISALVGSLLSIPPTKGIPVGPRAGFGATLVVAGAAAGFGASVAAVVVGFVGGVDAVNFRLFYLMFLVDLLVLLLQPHLLLVLVV
jgi:hypothetical protein